MVARLVFAAGKAGKLVKAGFLISALTADTELSNVFNGLASIVGTNSDKLRRVSRCADV